MGIGNMQAAEQVGCAERTQGRVAVGVGIAGGSGDCRWEWGQILGHLLNLERFKTGNNLSRSLENSLWKPRGEWIGRGLGGEAGSLGRRKRW